MYKLIILSTFLCLSIQAVEVDKQSLKNALMSSKTAAEVQKAMKELTSYTGSDKDKLLAKRIGKDNLTYFFLNLKEDGLKGYDLTIKGAPEQRSMSIFKKLFKDWYFINLKDVKNLKVEGDTGSFKVDNEILKGSLILRLNDKGQIIKMVIPKEGSKSIKDGKTVFTK